LYAIVFITRYLDLAWNFSSLYNYIFKVLFITLSVSIVYVMKYEKPYCRTYEPVHDDFNIFFLIIPCFALACFINEYLSVTEVLWTFSIYLEAVAILPQLIVIHRAAKETGGFVDALNSHYVFALGGYRALYLLNWVYRLLTEPGYTNWIVWVAGLVQTAIYCDFFYYYLKAQVEGKAMALPV
jgi:ER lumen protein retaining receptor